MDSRRVPGVNTRSNVPVGSCIDAILERPFERISVEHGDPILSAGPEALRASYDWLKS